MPKMNHREAKNFPPLNETESYDEWQNRRVYALCEALIFKVEKPTKKLAKSFEWGRAAEIKRAVTAHRTIFATVCDERERDVRKEFRRIFSDDWDKGNTGSNHKQNIEREAAAVGVPSGIEVTLGDKAVELRCGDGDPEWLYTPGKEAELYRLERVREFQRQMDICGDPMTAAKRSGFPNEKYACACENKTTSLITEGYFGDPADYRDVITNSQDGEHAARRRRALLGLLGEGRAATNPVAATKMIGQAINLGAGRASAVGDEDLFQETPTEEDFAEIEKAAARLKAASNAGGGDQERPQETGGDAGS